MKIEALVFAANSQLALSLIEGLFVHYPADLQGFNVSGGTENNLDKIYSERIELQGIDPDKGYIYQEMSHQESIRKYFK